MTTSGSGAGFGAVALTLVVFSLAGRVLRLGRDFAGALLARLRVALLAAPFEAAPFVEALFLAPGFVREAGLARLVERALAEAEGALVVRFAGALLGRFEALFLVVFLVARVLLAVRFVAMKPSGASHLIGNAAKGKGWPCA
ncbi:MAG: hypothetical protein AAF500_09455 [Myxococcota bacterium]